MKVLYKGEEWITFPNEELENFYYARCLNPRGVERSTKGIIYPSFEDDYIPKKDCIMLKY